MPMRHFRLLSATLAMAGTIAACGDKAVEEPAAEAEESAPVAGEATHGTTSTGMPRTPSPDGATVFFITPADGDTVSNPILVEFGIRGMTVVKAGDEAPDSGHHHLVIDAGLPNLGAPIPADEHYIHFGDASTSTQLTLEPGQHTLQLLLGDHLHVPHDPPVASEVITVTVE